MAAQHKKKECDLSSLVLSFVMPTVRDSEQNQQGPGSRSDPLKMTGSKFPGTSSPNSSPPDGGFQAWTAVKFRALIRQEILFANLFRQSLLAFSLS